MVIGRLSFLKLTSGFGPADPGENIGAGAYGQAAPRASEKFKGKTFRAACFCLGFAI